MSLTKLKTELETDPLGRGYSGMTDAEAANDLNLLNRDAPPNGSALLQYLTLEKFRTGTLYGRLKMVADSRPVKDGASWSIPPLPLGVADAEVTITQAHISAATSLLRYADVDVALTTTLLDSRLDSILDNLALVGGACEAIGAADKTAIQGLSQNQQSRATELGLSRVREGTVSQARGL